MIKDRKIKKNEKDEKSFNIILIMWTQNRFYSSIFDFLQETIFGEEIVIKINF